MSENMSGLSEKDIAPSSMVSFEAEKTIKDAEKAGIPTPETIPDRMSEVNRLLGDINAKALRLSEDIRSGKIDPDDAPVAKELADLIATSYKLYNKGTELLEDRNNFNSGEGAHA